MDPYYCALTNIEINHFLDFTFAPTLLFYAYVPIIVLSLFLGFFVYIKDKRSLRSKLLLYLTITFALLLFNEIIQWIGVYAKVVNFGWQVVPILRLLVPIFTVLFVFVFIEKGKISILVKSFIAASVLIVAILMPTSLNIKYFDIANCEGVPGLLWNLVHFFEILSIFLIGFFAFRKVREPKLDLMEKKQTIYLATGASLFLAIFFAASIWGDATTIYDVALIGPIGMIAFIAFLTFIIVRFKAFNIKLLGAQALVVGLVVLIGSQFFFIQVPINMLLTAITLIVAMVMGLAIVRSVRKEVALREELEIANSNQQALIHFISHQLKGFFTKSKMIFSSILEDDFEKTSPKMKEMAQMGMTSDNNAVAMIQDILNASDLKKGTTTYDLQTVDFTEIVKKVCKDLSDEMTAKGLVLKTDLGDKPEMVKADGKQIIHVVKNLIDNSIKYTPTGSINVSLKQELIEGKEKIVLKIEDTGIGLSESDKKKLFTEGGKGDDSLKVNVNSTGYGLYIVKKIVENHGGKIWAESAGRGHGSKFFVVLPVK